MKKNQKKASEAADGKKFKGLILSVQRVIDDIHPAGKDSMSLQGDSPLFHIAGESTIVAIDQRRGLFNGACSSEKKHSSSQNSNGMG